MCDNFHCPLTKTDVIYSVYGNLQTMISISFSEIVFKTYFSIRKKVRIIYMFNEQQNMNCSFYAETRVSFRCSQKFDRNR